MSARDDSQAIRSLAGFGLDAEAATDTWLDAVPLRAALDAIGREGGCTLVKVDGERPNGCVYTVLISGGRLGDEHFRKDGPGLTRLLQEAIEYYAAHARRGS